MDNATQRTRTEPTSIDATRPKSAYVIALCCVAAIGGFLFGFDSGVINGTVDALAKAFGTDAAGTGFAVASVLLGCAIGAFGAGRLADSLGRRPTMLLNAILFLATALATGAANLSNVFHRGADHSRCGHRRRQRIGADVHRRSRSGADARPPGVAATNGDCGGAV